MVGIDKDGDSLGVEAHGESTPSGFYKRGTIEVVTDGWFSTIGIVAASWFSFIPFDAYLRLN